jgi:hypothetical protein
MFEVNGTTISDKKERGVHKSRGQEVDPAEERECVCVRIVIVLITVTKPG